MIIPIETVSYTATAITVWLFYVLSSLDAKLTGSYKLIDKLLR